MLEISCVYCGKKFLRNKSALKYSKLHFCSHRCQYAAAKISSKNGKNFYGRSGNRQSARAILLQYNPNVKCIFCGFIKFKELIEVHHKDNNIFNNTKENLCWACIRCHKKLNYFRRIDPKLPERKSKLENTKVFKNTKGYYKIKPNGAKMYGTYIRCKRCNKKFFRTFNSINRGTKTVGCSRYCTGVLLRTKPLAVRSRRGDCIEHHPEIRCSNCNYNEFESLVEVHHIDKNRTNNIKNNLIWLCCMCHAAVTRGLAILKNGKLYDVLDKRKRFTV